MVWVSGGQGSGGICGHCRDANRRPKGAPICSAKQITTFHVRDLFERILRQCRVHAPALNRYNLNKNHCAGVGGACGTYFSPETRQTLCAPYKIAHLVHDPPGSYPEEKVVLPFYKPMEIEGSGNYLRAHRKRSGLSQEEVAIILGCDDGAMVSRHERSYNLPPLTLALGYEAIFLIPISQLFRGLSEAVKQATEERLSNLETELGTMSGKGPQAAIIAKKLVWLMERRSLQSAA